MIHSIFVPDEGILTFDDAALWFEGDLPIADRLRRLVAYPILRLPSGEDAWVEWDGPSACRLAFVTVEPRFGGEWNPILPERVRNATILRPIPHVPSEDPLVRY